MLDCAMTLEAAAEHFQNFLFVPAHRMHIREIARLATTAL